MRAGSREDCSRDASVPAADERVDTLVSAEWGMGRLLLIDRKMQQIKMQNMFSYSPFQEELGFFFFFESLSIF